ncbi:MAG: ribonuclease III, partial [Lentisphaerae bacterium]|nr:ribonuclease III [Lentisphaerota bacterium]
VYTVSASVHGGHLARGTGRTKQAAEKAAASALLQQLADAGVPLET